MMLLRKSIQRFLNPSISTGYPALDRALGGGYRRDSKIFINFKVCHNILRWHVPKGCRLIYSKELGKENLIWFKDRYKLNKHLVFMSGVHFEHDVLDLRTTMIYGKRWVTFAQQHDVILEFSYAHLAITKNYPQHEPAFLNWTYNGNKLEIT